MPTAHEHFSEQFERWEKRGRGWQMFPKPVSPEPPFVPFTYRPMAERLAPDDGLRPTLLSSFVQRLSRKMSTKPPIPPVIPQAEDEPEPAPLVRGDLVELQVSLSEDSDIKGDSIEPFFRSLSLCLEPIAFELLGTNNRVSIQFTASQDDVSLVRKQLAAHFPQVSFRERQGGLEAAWDASEGDEVIVVEFGLEREMMFQLATPGLDSFTAIIATLSELRPGELGSFQILWQSVHHPWAINIMEAVRQVDGKPLFVNLPELTSSAEKKLKSPLFAAVVRLMLRTDSESRLYELAREFGGSLRVFTNPEGNALIPLHNDDYLSEDHIEDVFLRQSRRTGMLLNSEELAGFVHLPGNDVRSSALKRDAGETKAAPPSVQQEQKLFIGYNEHAGDSIPVYLSPDQRTRHAHVIGSPGTGKSNFLLNLIIQDIHNGDGLAVLDPHGDLIEKILGRIPDHRIDDVVLVDPGDEEFSVPFNILSAHSELEKRLIASDLTAVFQRLSTSWGDQMTSVLNNAILAFLESSQGGTLADMRRFLIEPAFRAQFLKTVNDPNVVYYWQKGFPQLVGNKSVGPLLTRLDMLLAPKPISHMVSQKENRLDFSGMMKEGKIFLAKLSQGTMGYENSSIMGSLLMAKFHLAAMSRQNVSESARRPFYIYLDEAHNFATPSMVEILTGARKYRVGLILAHQELSQLERVKEIAGAILGCNTRVVFRVGDSDARKLSEGFSHFEAKHLQNLETGRAICKVERADHDFNLTVPFSEQPRSNESCATREAVIQSSRAKYATRRADVERALWEALRSEEKPPSEPVRPVPKDAEKSGSVPKNSEGFGTVQKPSEVQKSEPKSPVVKPQNAAVSASFPEKATDKIQSLTDEKDTGSEKAESVAEIPSETTQSVPITPHVSPKLTETKAPAIVPDLGRGGDDHQALQRQFKEIAEAAGFRAVIEKPILSGEGTVDVALEKSGVAIAVEVMVRTTIEQEVGKIRSRLRANFSRILIINDSKLRLERLKRAIQGEFENECHRIECCHPDDFSAWLTKVSSSIAEPTTTPGSNEKMTRGRKSKVSFAKLSPEEQKIREAAIHKLLVDSMRRKKK